MASMMSSPDNSEIESLIEVEERILELCANYLRTKTPLSSWDAEVRDAFLLAINYSGENDVERQKAYAMRRHLGLLQFCSDTLPPVLGSTSVARAAERLRADLIRLVGLKTGVNLISNQPR